MLENTNLFLSLERLKRSTTGSAYLERGLRGCNDEIMVVEFLLLASAKKEE
jgi:hypothetical protein